MGGIAAASLLMVGSLNNGWLLDDHVQRLMLSGSDALPWVKAASWDAYRLIPSDDSFVNAVQEMGFSPWWGSDNYQATFFRPLSSLTLYLDYVLWPDSALMAHLHSMIWFVMMCAVAFVLFQRLLPSRASAALAAGLYILDDAHIFPATWVANRNALIAATFAFLALLFHIQRQQEGWRPGVWLAPLTFATALLCGEFALSISGFLFAHVLFLETGNRRQKAVRLLPYGIIVVVWRGAYTAMGYGVWGSDLYIDPLHNPGEFLHAVLTRLPILLNSGFGWPGAEGSIILPQYLWVLTLFSVGALGVYFWVLRPLVKNSASARFFMVGTVISLIPACATFAHDRLLIIAGIGIFGVIALFIEPLLFSTAPVPASISVPTSVLSKRRVQGFGVYWLVIHGAISPLSTPIKAEVPQFLGKMSDAATLSLPDSVGEQTVVVVAAPDMFSSAFIPLWRHALGKSIPAHTVALYNGNAEMTLIRETEQSLIFEVPDGQLGVWTDQLVRRADDLFAVGDAVVRAGVRFQVLNVNRDGNPTRIRATFSKSLNDPSISCWQWAGREYLPVSVPDRGDQIKISVNVFDFLR